MANTALEAKNQKDSLPKVTDTLGPAPDPKDSKENRLLVHDASNVAKVIDASNIISSLALGYIPSWKNQRTFEFVGGSLVGVSQTGLGGADKGEQDNEAY